MAMLQLRKSALAGTVPYQPAVSRQGTLQGFPTMAKTLGFILELEFTIAHTAGGPTDLTNFELLAALQNIRLQAVGNWYPFDNIGGLAVAWLAANRGFVTIGDQPILTTDPNANYTRRLTLQMPFGDLRCRAQSDFCPPAEMFRSSNLTITWGPAAATPNDTITGCTAQLFMSTQPRQNARPYIVPPQRWFQLNDSGTGPTFNPGNFADLHYRIAVPAEYAALTNVIFQCASEQLVQNIAPRVLTGFLFGENPSLVSALAPWAGLGGVAGTPLETILPLYAMPPDSAPWKCFQTAGQRPTLSLQPGPITLGQLFGVELPALDGPSASALFNAAYGNIAASAVALIPFDADGNESSFAETGSSFISRVELRPVTAQ